MKVTDQQELARLIAADVAAQALGLDKTEINRVPWISTAHLDQLTREELDAKDRGSVMKGDYGWMLYFDGEKHDEELPYDYPDCLRDVHAWAMKNNFLYVVFDADAPVVEELQIYE